MTDLQSNKAVIKLFWQHASRYPVLLWGMILTLPLGILIFEFLPALITSNILGKLSRHEFIKGNLWGSFGPEILLAIGLSALGGIVIWRLNIYFNWKLEGFVIRDISQRVFDHLMRLGGNFHANNFTGSLVSQTSKLTSSYTRITDTTVYQTGALLWSLVFASVLLWRMAPLFVVLLDVFSVLYMACSVLITRKIRQLTTVEADASNKQTGQLADGITNVMAVKSFSAGARESKRFGIVSEKARMTTLNLMFSTLKVQSTFASISTVIKAVSLILSVASVVVYGADIRVVFLIFTYTVNVEGRLWQFSGQALRNYNRGFGEAKAMMETLQLEPEVLDPAKPEEPRIQKGEVCFNDVNFTHADMEDDSLFVGLNLKIKAGERIGLVGHSGSGKTSLTRILLRFSDIEGGEILIDGQNISRIKQDDLRRAISYVPQEPLLFHRSIRENIAYGKPDATKKEIVEAARKAHALEFIEKLPKGFDTLVGERGVKLSGGQRQRVAIARTILKDAPILVLDEATSALDSESEVLIQDALWQMMQHRTAIVIAHRLSTVQKMDRIIVLERGKIVEEGAHKDLLALGGTYAKLWAHQSGGFIED